MKKLPLFLITFFVLAGLVLAACSQSGSASLAGEWKLVSYGEPASPTPAAPNVATSIKFGKDGKVNGNVGCNSFGGDYKVDGDKVTFGPLMSTMMACADPIGQQEGAVFSVLVNTATFQMDGNTLTITSADGKSAVVLTRK